MLAKTQEVEHVESVFALGSLYFRSVRHHNIYILTGIMEKGLLFVDISLPICQIKKENN